MALQICFVWWEAVPPHSSGAEKYNISNLSFFKWNPDQIVLFICFIIQDKDDIISIIRIVGLILNSTCLKI